jgi:hypothetical protein
MKAVGGQESVMISPLCIFRRGAAASEDHRVGILVLANDLNFYCPSHRWDKPTVFLVTYGGSLNS